MGDSLAFKHTGLAFFCEDQMGDDYWNNIKRTLYEALANYKLQDNVDASRRARALEEAITALVIVD